MIPVSLLSSYQYCPRKIFLERVLKFIDIPRVVTLKGTLRHAAFDKLNKSEMEIIARATEKLYPKIEALYRKTVSTAIRQAIIDNKRTIIRLRLDSQELHSSVIKRLGPEIMARAKNVYDFMDKTGLVGEDLWYELTPRIKSEYKVTSYSLGLSGVIDQVLVAGDILTPVELKTGSVPKEGFWPGHKLQLAAYMMLLEDQFNIEINKGTIRYLDANEEKGNPISRDLILNPFLRDEVVQTRIKVEKLLGNSLPPDRIKNEKKCEKCALKDDCFDEMRVNKRLNDLNVNL
jgi:CRISPR-associated protein Cas4